MSYISLFPTDYQLDRRLPALTKKNFCRTNVEQESKSSLDDYDYRAKITNRSDM